MVPGLNPRTAQAAGVPSSFPYLSFTRAVLVCSEPMSPDLNTPAEKKALRARMRARRRALSPAERAAAAERFQRRLWPQLQPPRCQRIAVYLAFDGELDLLPLIGRLWAANKEVYLPVVSRLEPQRLWFRRYEQNSPMKRNRFGILEPISGVVLASRQLDVVLLPLTAFDRHGNRLGMGGGFYDRTFAYRRHSLASRPRLIGVGYHWQQVEALAREPHDLPVQGIATD